MMTRTRLGHSLGDSNLDSDSTTTLPWWLGLALGLEEWWLESDLDSWICDLPTTLVKAYSRMRGVSLDIFRLQYRGPVHERWRYGYWANSTSQEETATDIAVRKRWRRCSTYVRPVGGAVLPLSALTNTELKYFKLSKMRHGWIAWSVWYFATKKSINMPYIGMVLHYIIQI